MRTEAEMGKPRQSGKEPARGSWRQRTKGWGQSGTPVWHWEKTAPRPEPLGKVGGAVEGGQGSEPGDTEPKLPGAKEHNWLDMGPQGKGKEGRGARAAQEERLTEEENREGGRAGEREQSNGSSALWKESGGSRAWGG